MTDIKIKGKFELSMSIREMLTEDNKAKKMLANNDLGRLYDYVLDQFNDPYTHEVGNFTHFLFHIGVDIFDYLDYIPSCCFSDLTLEYFNIPDNVRKLGYAAFYDCATPKLVVPGRIKTISYTAFETSYINEIILEEGVEKIDDLAFTDISHSKIYIPMSVKFISDTAFNNVRDISIVTDNEYVKSKLSIKTEDEVEII